MANYFNNYGQMQRQGGEILAVPVQGEIGAQNYLVAAGNTVLLTDFNSGLLWLKSTDANGLFSSLRTFEVKEITPQPKANGDFVSQTEFNDLKNQMLSLLASINGLIGKGEISNANATVNTKSSTVSDEVQRICNELSAKQQGNIASANGSKPVEQRQNVTSAV